MIMPDKNIRLSYSLLGVGSLLLKNLSRPKSVSALWDSLKKYNEINSFEKFVLSLDVLFSLNLIILDDGLLRRIKND